MERAIDLLLDTLTPWDAGSRYPNFADRGTDASQFSLPPETLDKLRRIKAVYDPDDLIRDNHPSSRSRPGQRRGKRSGGYA